MHLRPRMIGAQGLGCNEHILVPACRAIFEQTVAGDQVPDVHQTCPRLSRSRLIHAKASLVVEGKHCRRASIREDLVEWRSPSDHVRSNGPRQAASPPTK